MTEARKQLAILALHKVGRPAPGGWETWNYVSEDCLRAFLEICLAEDFTFVEHARVVDAYRSPEAAEALPDKAALVSFDDGYRSMLENAAPILEDYGASGLLFVPTDYVGATNRFDEGREPSEAMCSWDELRALRDRAWSIQSHSKTHRSFSSLTRAQRCEELHRSKRVLEDELECAVEALAFPYGDAGGDDAQRAETCELLRDAGYAVAYVYKGGIVTMDPLEQRAPRFAVTRIALGPDSDLRSYLRGERR